MVTFPQAFHGGFSYGFNCGEAVNFATPDWVQHARVANERYRRSGRLAVISHDRLMFTLRANEGRDTIDGQARRILREELRRLVVEDEIERHATRWLLTSGLHAAGEQDGRDKYSGHDV